MNSDNTGTITIIPLGSAYLQAPLISSEIVEMMEECKKAGKGVLIFYSRRGNARAWVCNDCGQYEKCPHCDIALAYHTLPTKRLMCHQCNTVAPFPISCPNCQSNRISPVGVGIQQIEESLSNILGNSYNLLRIDSDSSQRSSDTYDGIAHNDIILSTRIGSSIVHPHIGAVVWLSFELNLSIPSYRIEEEIFHEITYYKKQSLPLYIQTYTPDHPLLRSIIAGNTRSFLGVLTSERKSFNYPPFAELATIRIHAEQKEKVSDMMRRIINKIELIKPSHTFMAFDRDIWERIGGEWQQKIVLKDKNLQELLKGLEVEIVRNRCVTLEWN